MQGIRIWTWQSDPLAQGLFEEMKVNPLPLSITEVLTALQTGMIDAVYCAPYAAVGLQWFTRVKYMLDLPLTNATGAPATRTSRMNRFGVAPAFLVASLSVNVGLGHPRLVWLSCLVFAVCAGLRLARFNVETGLDQESHEWFEGLPSPAAAGQVASLVILHFYLVENFKVGFLPRLLPTITFVAGVLMVSRVRYRHVVSQFLGERHGFAELAFVAIVVVLVITHKELTIATAFSLYVGVGVAAAVRAALAGRAEEEKPIF